MLADFQNSFTIVVSKKFATKLLPHFTSQLKCVTALPCEISNIKFNHFRFQLLQTLPKSRLFNI